MKNHAILTILCLLGIFNVTFGQNSTNAAATFQQYVAQLQNSPEDQTLRSNIILFAATMKSPPAIPTEANRHFIIGNTLYHDAKISSDYQLAASEYHQALLLAPWWGTVYANEGLALQKAGQYDAAIADLNLYLLTQPADAADVTNQIYTIEAEKELAAKRAADAAQQQAQQAAAVEQQKEQQAKEEQQQAAQEQQQAEQQQQAAQEKESQKLVGKWKFSAANLENSLCCLVISYDGANYSASMDPNPCEVPGHGEMQFTITSFNVVENEVKFTIDTRFSAYPTVIQSGDAYDVSLSADGSKLEGTVKYGSYTDSNNPGFDTSSGPMKQYTMPRVQ